MDGHRFDALARAFAARSQSRRTFLSQAAALAAAWAAAAGRRPAAVLAGPVRPSQVDLVATLIQPTDAALGAGDWAILKNGWSHDLSALPALPPALAGTVQAKGGVASGAASVLVASGTNATTPVALVKSLVLQCRDDTAAKGIFDGYRLALAPTFAPLDAASLLGETTDAIIGTVAVPDDSDLSAALPNSAATLAFYREGSLLAGVLVVGEDDSFAAGVAKVVIERTRTGKMPGHDLVASLAVTPSGSGPYDAWYSRLDGKAQRRFGATADEFAAQEAAEGNAIDFARLSQVISTSDPHANYRLSTWAGEFASDGLAQDWINGVAARLKIQSPAANLVPINEADGYGDAAVGFLYTLSLDSGTSVGADLYVRRDSTIFATGFSAAADATTPSFGALLADPRPLRRGAQLVMEAQLVQPDPFPDWPRLVDLNDVFAASPLKLAPSAGNAGTTSEGAFSACTPDCNKPAKQDQVRPYQVWCQPSTKCTDAHCTCNLFRTKKKTANDEWFGKQNEKKEYDPDNYTYACKCGTIKTASGSSSGPAASVPPPQPDLAFATLFPGRDVSRDYQLAGGTYCVGLDACEGVGALPTPVRGWIPTTVNFLLYNQTLHLPGANGAQLPASAITSSVYFFDTSANAKTALANWTQGYAGAEPIPVKTEGWSLFGFAGTQNGASFDAVAGMLAADNYFLYAQQTDYGSKVDRGPWTETIPAALSGHLSQVRAGRAPNPAALAINPFSNQSETNAWFGNYFALDGVYARTEGQSDAAFAKQAGRNAGVAFGYQGGFFAKNGAVAATTVRRFMTNAGEQTFYTLVTNPDRQDAVQAGFLEMPFDNLVVAPAALTVDPFFGVDASGVPGVTVDIGAAADRLTAVLSLDDGVVKVPKGGTLTSGYIAAVHAGIERWTTRFAQSLPGGSTQLATVPASPPPASFLPELETLDNACQHDLSQCVA